MKTGVFYWTHLLFYYNVSFQDETMASLFVTVNLAALTAKLMEVQGAELLPAHMNLTQDLS